MSYQTCRWYDPYPRLAFAFKLLYLAPQKVREAVLSDLAEFVDLYWGDLDAYRVSMPSANRLYDVSDDVSRCLELIRRGNDHLKELAANRLLSALKQAA